MPNNPLPAKEKRSDPGPRQNAQDDHEGSAHSPDEFDEMNPQKQGLREGTSAARKTLRAPKA